MKKKKHKKMCCHMAYQVYLLKTLVCYTYTFGRTRHINLEFTNSYQIFLHLPANKRLGKEKKGK